MIRRMYVAGSQFVKVPRNLSLPFILVQQPCKQLFLTVSVKDYESKAVGEDKRVAQDQSRRCWGKEGAKARAMTLCPLRRC